MPSIEIVEYDPAWPDLFEKEKARILSVAGAYIDDIQHIGSTSVPGLAAKPSIDMLVELSELSLVEKCIQPLQTLGYEYLGENGLPTRHFFRKPAGASWTGRLSNVHAVEKGSAEWRRMLSPTLTQDAGEDFFTTDSRYVVCQVVKKIWGFSFQLILC